MNKNCMNLPPLPSTIQKLPKFEQILFILQLNVHFQAISSHDLHHLFTKLTFNHPNPPCSPQFSLQVRSIFFPQLLRISSQRSEEHSAATDSGEKLQDPDAVGEAQQQAVDGQIRFHNYYKIVLSIPENRNK